MIKFKHKAGRKVMKRAVNARPIAQWIDEIVSLEEGAGQDEGLSPADILLAYAVLASIITCGAVTGVLL